MIAFVVDLIGVAIILYGLLAYLTGSVDQELLLRNEFLAAEHRILPSKIQA